MKVPFFITIVAEIITVVIQTEALPDWRWNLNSKHISSLRHRTLRNDGCHPGQCVQAWKCPETAISSRPTGSCGYWENGPWVCCILADDNQFEDSAGSEEYSLQFTTKFPDVSSELRPKQIEKYIRKQKSSSTITKFDLKDKKESGSTTPCGEDTSNTYSRKKPIPVSSLGYLPADPWKKPNQDESWDEPHYDEYWDISTDFPNFNEWKKTTKNSWNKWTTSNSQNSWTTKRKLTTDDTRIVFPTEFSYWTKKTTKRPKSTTLLPDKTTSTYDRKTTARPWVQPSSSTSTFRPSWSVKPVNVDRATPRTTQPSNTRKPSLSTRSTNNVGSGFENRRNQGSGRSTSRYPDMNPTIQPQNGRTQSTRGSTTRSPTTRRNSITTPVPDINTHYCGIRDRRALSGHRGRNYSPNTDIIYTGSRNSRGRQEFQRIVGGEEAVPYSWPWVAALYKVSSSGVNRFLSAGSLINKNFVLTAAHPFTKDDIRSSSYIVMLGTHTAEDAIAQYHVSSVIQHPQYEQRFYYHDIALLRLERPVQFNDFVMPLCLPSPNAPLLRDRDLEGKNVTVMGWGDQSFGGKTSRVLKEATFPIASRRSCNASYVRVASNRFPKGITENMLCAGGPNGGKDACQGDSGGPLTSVVQGRHTQVGIVSFGYQCGDKDFPGVYTKVAPYLGWIAENTERVRDYNG